MRCFQGFLLVESKLTKLIQDYVFQASPGFSPKHLYFNKFLGLNVYFRAAARNLEYLGLLGVTHVLNTAEAFWARMTVNTSQEYYSPAGMMSTL